jgi:undecaprenyl-diphosphatase
MMRASMSYTQAVTLGVVQGLTEFLPVSSSAHLLLVPRVFGWPDQGLAVDAAVHLGTLIALLLYFRRELIALGRGARPRRLVWLVCVATAPGALAGWLAEELVATQLRSATVVAAATAFWALVMAAADRRAPASCAGPRDPLDLVTLPQALSVGCAQALALVPGTSRSGITITAGLLGGLDRPTAARFAFLVGIPITAAAGGHELLRLLRAGPGLGDLATLLVAMGAAWTAGWVAIWALVAYLRRRSLRPFVLYRLALAAAILVLSRG